MGDRRGQPGRRVPATRTGPAMNPEVAVEVIIGIFFLIGVAVGIIAVIALAALRGDRKDKPPGPPDAGPGGHADDRDDRPRWPGAAGDGFYRG